jgi:hypothetical protein
LLLVTAPLEAVNDNERWILPQQDKQKVKSVIRGRRLLERCSPQQKAYSVERCVTVTVAVEYLEC